MLRKPDFYRKVVDIQHRYARPDMIVNSIQTNGTLITDEWCEFLSDNNWLVGVSIDGPREITMPTERTLQVRVLSIL